VSGFARYMVTAIFGQGGQPPQALTTLICNFVEFLNPNSNLCVTSGGNYLIISPLTPTINDVPIPAFALIGFAAVGISGVVVWRRRKRYKPLISGKENELI
jgi:LPXTG-motif cell wall-anchored protein